MNEIYNKIEFTNNYYVSNYGNIKSIINSKEKILKTPPSKKGYPQCRLKNIDNKWITYYVHRLVAETFIRKIKKNEQIDHRDKNKSNNNLSNLDIVDNRINQLRNKRSILPGVYVNKKGNNIRMRCVIDKIVYTSSHITISEAHEQYKKILNYNGIYLDFSKDLVCKLDDN